MFDNKEELIRFMTHQGVKKILYKCLTENDNSKQQIYLGGSFDALNQIPFGEVLPSNINGSKPNFKAALNFFWINDEGQIKLAPKAQLILYPKYPEVRLSGFLQGCSIAPSNYLQHIPSGKRQNNNGRDGRVLIFGIRNDDRILAYLAPAGTSLANELITAADTNNIFTYIQITSGLATITELLSEIKNIKDAGWLSGRKMNSQGAVVDYNAQNGGGYTFEACLGIIPNGRSEPDWMGWEVKAFSDNIITLMTPEPDAGHYGEHNVRRFVQEYGHVSKKGELYFTGIHRCGILNKKTGMKMFIDGYDANTDRITNVTGGLTLLDSEDNPAAIWTFAKLIEHWGRKHARTVYIPYIKQKKQAVTEYQYINPIMLGIGTDFYKFLRAFNDGFIYYDPGSKLFINERGHSQTKARNQFRINKRNLTHLYDQFSVINL